VAINGGISPSGSPALVSKMGNVLQFIPRKPELDREARLIREARAIYESIFPTEIARIGPSGRSDSST
jgi:hypothetical protein